jgi:outer membrane protein
MRTFVRFQAKYNLSLNNIDNNMKKLVILLFTILPLAGFAQEVKIATVNQSEIFNAMPEVSAGETQIAALNEQYDKELKVMQDEYTKKYTEYVEKQDSLTENIKLRRQQDIQDMASRIENFMQVARQELEKKQQEVFTPIQEKMLNAIKAVGEEKGYTYIFTNNPQIVLYTGNNATDATPFVKAKLGLK